MPKIGFRSISCERPDGLGSYFAYLLLLITPSLVLSHDIFRHFSAEILSLIIGQKRFPLNICEIMDRFCKLFAVGNMWLGIVIWRILYSFSRIRALVSNPKMVSAHYLVKELMDLDHILHTYYC